MQEIWIVLPITGIVVLVMMFFIFRENAKTQKAYQQDLDRYSDRHDKEFEINDKE
jgi:preprotein translocase subunit YajC